MSLITSLEHAYAVAAQFVVNEARTIENKVLPVLKKLETEAPTIAQVTQLVSPTAAGIERTGFALVGLAIKTIEDAGAAAVAGGLNVTLDAQLIADLKAILPTIKGNAPPVTPAA